MLSVTSTPVELIDDNTAQQYYNDLDTLEGAERDSRAEALRLWADQKDADQKREQFDTLNKIYSDFDGYVNDAGLQDFDEESRYRTANRQFIASQFDDTVENQQPIYPSFRDKWTESVAGKKGLSEKETFDLIKQGIDARNEVSQAANEIPGDIALALFDSLDGGDPVDVPKLIDTWKTKNAESIKKLPKGWETPLLEAAQKYHTETDTMLRDYAEPLKQVYDHFAAVTGRDTERAGESNPKNQEELDSLVDTLASMPKPVRERAYASVVLGAKKAGQDPKTFMDQWGESWSRTLNMVRTGALTAQEMAAESEARQLEDKASPPDYYISKSTGEKIPLANRAFHDEADLRKVTPEEIAADAAKARQKVKRFEVVRELQSVADNQFDPIEKINKGGFLGFMEAMAYGTPQSLAYTGTALIPVVGPYLAGTAIFADEYNQLREQGMSVDQAVQVGSVSAGIQAGLERTGAELIFGKLPVFEKLMRRIANPARVGKAGSAGIRFFSAALGENITEGAQDLTTPLVQDVSEALGADVPDVQWQPILEKWSGSRLDVLAATIPTILLGTGVATFGDNKRFAQFEERQDIYRSMGMDDATIKEIEDGKDISEKQQKFQTAFSKLTPENVKAGVAYMEEKIASAQGQQQDPNTPTLTRATLADGTTQFIVRDEQGRIAYRTAEEQSAQIAMRELLRNQITGSTRGIVESLQFIDQVNQSAGRGEDVQKLLLDGAPRTLLDDYEANPTQQNLDNLFATVRAFGQDINEPAELANFPVLASNQGALAEGIFKSVIRIQDGATGVEVMRDFSQDNLKRAIGEGRVTMDWVREQLNQVIPLIESDRLEGRSLRTETDTDVIESFSDVAVAYMNGRIRDEQVPAGFRGFLRRMAIVVKDIFRRAYRLKRAIADGKVDSNFESFLADSVGLNQQARVDTASSRVSKDIITDGGQMLMDFSIGSRTSAVSADTPSIRATNATITGPANYSIGAFHGTPHKVDKFTTAKIGTGEGAQAYGWGLYFAENRNVADAYMKGMKAEFDTPKGRVKFEEMDFGDGALAADYVNQANGDFDKALQLQAKFAATLESNNSYTSKTNRVRQLLEQWKSEGWKWVIPPGNLYTVDLDAEPEDLLDWDKPLSEQSEKVQAAIKKVITDPTGQRAFGASGKLIYENLLREVRIDGSTPPKKASEKLASLGIKGIRYLDGQSRDSGSGTYNYVVFDENLIKITEENGNRIAAADALAAPAPGATNYSIGKKKSAGGIRFDEITKEDPKHDGSRVGTAWQGKVKPTTQDTNDGIATINSKELEKQMAMLTHFVDGVPLPEFITKFQNPEERMRAFIDFQKENLLALYDAFDALSHDYVIRSTHWYDGARLLAEGIRDLYGLTIEQSSAVIAVFSPMKDWFQNVAMGQRFADVMANHKDTQISKATVGNAMSEMLTAAENESDLRKAFKKIKGRSISQLLADKTEEGRKVTAVAVRLMSTHVHGLTHDVLSPEGESLGIRKNLDGTNKKLVWQSYTFIEKALSIYEDGSAKNISKVLGTEHKIRNFYNNIVAPTSPYGDATVDTHAVNAAVLFPMGNKGYLVNLNFGGAGVAGGGNSGTYWLFHEALREAAAARKVMPRQMQSITWEAIRGLFTDVKKRDKNFVANIAKIWQTSQDANSARTQIIKLGITPPEWARVGSANSGIQGGVGKNAGQNTNSAGSVRSGVRQGRKGGDGSGGVNYSIASQSEIDRVNRALGGMNRGPDERLKVYQRAKQKFSKLMAWNSDELAAMADTGSDDSQIRRTQILQALGELDGILSVLPPEVRGRVGGYTKLAGIAPMDVLKDGVKVSEVSGMNGAIISAWMREGQNIGQAGKQVSLPPGYTATENLSTKRADKAIADFFRDRIKRIDTELEKVLVREYTEAITKAVKQSRPKAGDNGVRKSTLGAETQKFADMVQRATLLDDEATPKRMAEIEAALTNPDATAEDVSALSEEWSILNTFGDLDNRSSETLAQGLDWLKGQLQMGREAWRIKEQARIDEQRARARQTIEWLGKGTAKKRFADKGLMQRIAEVGNNYLLDHASFEQFVTAMLPPEIAANFSERLRKADMAAQASEIRDGKGILDAVRAGAKAANMSAGDAMLWLKGDQKNAVSYLEGRKVKDERIAIDLAQKIVTGEADRSKLTDADVETLRNELAALPADTQKEFVTIKRVIFRGEDVKLDMSRAKAMQLLLSWNQPDVQNKMRKEGWTDESAADLNALVNDPVSREVMAYAKELYGKGAGIVNPVYSRMFGMAMPQVKNYAPTRFLNAKDSKDIGLDGSPTATGTTPSFAKSRVTHSAKIAPEDALTVMQGHIAQQAHWVHFAELAREFRALLSSPEVRESLKQTHGDAVLKSAELWADQLEQRGGNKARESAWLNNVIGTAISGKAVASLGFNLKTLAMQLENTIRFGLALDMKQIVSALSNPSAIVEDIQTVWESNAIQNRLQGGATAEARFLFSRYAGKPNFAAKIAEASMTPINWLDSAGTSISSAIVYRANLNDALAAGMPENLAKQAALNAASEAIYRFAQPVSFGQKSIIENNGNVFAKTFFLFMSDPRLKTAILADAARGLATGRGNTNEHIRRIVAVELMALVSHVISSAFKDAFSDDDDEEIWGIGGFAKAMLLAPFQGFFFAGSVAEVALSKLTGQGYFTSSQNPLLNTAESAIRAGSNLDDAFNFSDPEAMLKQWNNIFRSMALSPAMAAPAVLLNMVKPALGLYQNATTED